MSGSQVLFDPSNPYRRKSSLVTNEATSPTRVKQASTHCLVHQFLESQRAGNGLRRRDPSRDSSGALSHEDEVVDAAEHHDLHRVVEPKGRGQERRAILEASASDSGEGQLDQQQWKEGIIKSGTELDLVAVESAAVHSRLLTKRQLSDMAWGVRELSRRLGSMRLKFRVKTIFLLTKIFDEDLIPKTRELTRWLLDKEREVRYTVYVERSLKDNKLFDAAGLLDDVCRDYVAAGEMEEEAIHTIARRLRYWDSDMCRTRPHTFDFVVTLGGDGTVLYASWLFQRIVPPVLSFALGSLGFLTKFDFDNYQSTLTTAFNTGVTVSLRLRFEGTVMRSQKKKQTNRDLVEELVGEEKDDEHTHRPNRTYEILNEIVIDRGPNPSELPPFPPQLGRMFVLVLGYGKKEAHHRQAMSATEIFGDDEHFTSVLADGICVSTPTGSTAYNLAAGGSLCHPENPVMLVTSICAHTLSFRPIILPDTIVLRVGVPYDARTSSWASFDGRERVELHPGDYVTISASRYPFASVQAPGRRSEDWINSISGKLGWNTRQKQKSYKEWEK